MASLSDAGRAVTLLVAQPVLRWDIPAAQQLLLALCELYPEREAALEKAEQVGMQRYKLRADNSVYFLWHEILSSAAPQGRLKGLIDRVLEDNPHSVRSDFLRALLRQEPEEIAVDARAKPAGTSGFLAGDDTVTHPEALLFHDDLSLKIGRLPWLMRALERVGAQASSVCKIVATGPAGTQNGTGFLIGPGLVMTNWHVVESKGVRAYLVRALFGYDDDGGDGTLRAEALNADLDSLKGDAFDDWAVFRVAGSPPEAAAVINLSQAAAPVIGEAAFIVQHPGGETKRIAYARNTVTDRDERVVHYLSDTSAGSSGSPVFNDEGRIVALHHAGGEPQQVAGKPPIMKNEGIRIDRIAAQMKEMGCEIA